MSRKGFKLVEYSPLGLKDVLCVPAKEKVNNQQRNLNVLLRWQFCYMIKHSRRYHNTLNYDFIKTDHIAEPTNCTSKWSNSTHNQTVFIGDSTNNIDNLYLLYYLWQLVTYSLKVVNQKRHTLYG